MSNVAKYRKISQTNPLPVSSIDPSGRVGLNSVFGERIQGIRKTDIAAQFQYGFPAGDAEPNIANGGTITTDQSMLTVSTGTDPNGKASIANRKALRYLPGHEAYIWFTMVLTEGVANSYQRGGIFNDQDGFFVGYEGADFKFTRRRAGTDYSVTLNIEDVFDDGSFDPTLGNIYRISFGYLGFAPINLEILNPQGTIKSVYEIEYPNSDHFTHITNTNLQPRLEVLNFGNTTNIVAKTGSINAGIVNGGGSDPSSRYFSKSIANKTITAGNFPIITFRSKSTFNSLTNYIQSEISLISPATDLSKNSIWQIRRNMTITNTPTWTDINTTDSITEYSEDATLDFATGEEMISFTMGKTDSRFERLLDQLLEIFPNDTFHIVLITPTGTTGSIDLGVRIKELF